MFGNRVFLPDTDSSLLFDKSKLYNTGVSCMAFDGNSSMLLWLSRSVRSRRKFTNEALSTDSSRFLLIFYEYLLTVKIFKVPEFPSSLACHEMHLFLFLLLCSHSVAKLWVHLDHAKRRTVLFSNCFLKKDLGSVANNSLTIQIEILQACQLSEGIAF